MKTLVKKTAATATLAAGLAGAFYAGQQNAPAPDLNTVEAIQKSGKKQLVVMAPKGASFQARNKALGALEVTGEGVDSVTVQVSPTEEKVLKESLPEGWQVVEDRVYSIKFGCKPKEPGAPDDTSQRPPTRAQVPWGILKIQALEAAAINDAKAVKVCITDTGADLQHPDINSMIVGGKSFIPGRASFDDDQGHGTHVAGTVAATANSIDVVGVSQARLYIVKVLDKNGSGFGSWIANGINECVRAGAQIISMSLGSPASAGSDAVIARAIDAALSKGVKVIAAAGNDGKGVGYPAAQKGVIAVSATDAGDRLAYFSSRGPEITFAAPGVDVLSTANGGGVTYMSGTSMATPHVAGVMALALATGHEVGVENIGLAKEYQGKGRVNALKTVKGLK